MGARAQRRLLSGRRLISRNRSSPLLSSHSSPLLLNSFLFSCPFLSLSFCHFLFIPSPLLFFPSFVSHLNSSSSAPSPLFIIHLLLSPAWHASLLPSFSLLFFSFPLTFPPHHCPPLLYLPFITSAPLFPEFSSSVCQSSPFLLPSFCFSSLAAVHLLSSSVSSTSNSTTRPVHPQFSPDSHVV